MESPVIEHFYLGCLAHASYMIVSRGDAAVIDPQRDVDIYLQAAAQHGAKIKHIIETHLHADFVSGHLELAERTGARIYLGAGSGAKFPHTPVKDGNSMRMGDCLFEILQTPGHTLESICVVMTAPNLPKTVFTGDTLFVGDVGRPDLSPVHTPQELAAMLYQSLHTKLLTLPDDTVILPAHGAGSLCGRQLGNERSSTIGKERRFNYALQAKNADEFIRLVADNLPCRPEYFGRDVELNRTGAEPMDALPALKALTPDEVARLQEAGSVVLDTRPAMEFAVGHIPGSIHIDLSGQYASWAGRVLGLDRSLILMVDDQEHAREAQLRLARVGIEKVRGYLEGGVTAWIKGGRALNYIPQISVAELKELRDREGDHIALLDVRESAEHSAGAIPNAISIPLAQLESRVAELDKSKLIVVHCKGGYRSSIATSLLRRHGFEDIANLTGGYDAWAAAA